MECLVVGFKGVGVGYGPFGDADSKGRKGSGGKESPGVEVRESHIRRPLA